jgi:hypothetical protein
LVLLGYFFIEDILVSNYVNKFHSKKKDYSDSFILVQENFKTLAIFLSFGSLVSPVVFTLTKTISTDTIYAMSTLMMLTHLIFYDYGAETAM